MPRVAKHIVNILIGFMAIIVVMVHVHCKQSESSPNLTYLNHHDTVSYVGMQTCRSCHASIYNTFIETGMGQSFGLATAQKSSAKRFGKHEVVWDKRNNLGYYPHWQNEQLYITEFRLKGKDTVYSRTEMVNYIVGSGQHTNSHLMDVNGYVYQMPLTWYAQKGRWDLPPGFENGQNPKFSRAIGVECMSCHNAMPEFDEQSENRFTTIPKGIDCERCHGPGELHVAEKLAGKLVDTATQIDYTIVNPKKLSRDLQIDLCQRCHLQGNAVLKPGKKFTDFRPGMRLGDFIDIYMPKYQGGEEEFIMASHAQRLQMSACYLSAPKTEKLTCISCHNPHVSVKVTGTQVYNNSCNSCHTTAQKNTCTAPVAQLNAVKNNCVKCHMPKSGTIDIPHVTVTDHYIRKPVSIQTKKALKEFVGIYCINNTNSDAFTRGNAYISYVEKFSADKKMLDSASYYLQQSGTTNQDAMIHVWYVKNDFSAIIKAAATRKPGNEQNAWLCYRIGRAYFVNTNYHLAKAWYKQAVSLAPNTLDFINALGAVYVELNEWKEAEKYLKASLKWNEKQAEPWSNLGYLKAKQQLFNDAMMLYDRALKIDPDYEQALLNKAALLVVMNQPKQAKLIAKQVLARNPNHIVAQQLIQSIP